MKNIWINRDHIEIYAQRELEQIQAQRELKQRIMERREHINNVPNDPNQWTNCGNCHSELNKDDKYCRCCGAKRGEGKFEPYRNLMQTIYGPRPIKRIRQCTKCTNEWETFLMVDKENYCPMCGSPSIIISEDKRY